MDNIRHGIDNTWYLRIVNFLRVHLKRTSNTYPFNIIKIYTVQCTLKYLLNQKPVAKQSTESSLQMLAARAIDSEVLSF